MIDGIVILIQLHIDQAITDAQRPVPASMLRNKKRSVVVRREHAACSNSKTCSLPPLKLPINAE